MDRHAHSFQPACSLDTDRPTSAVTSEKDLLAAVRLSPLMYQAHDVEGLIVATCAKRAGTSEVALGSFAGL